MSTSNGSTTTQVLDIDALIERAKKRAADGEATRQKTAEDDSLRQEKESLEVEVKRLRQELDEMMRASRIVSNDPQHVHDVEKVLTELGSILYTGDGQLTDLKSLREQILKVQHAGRIDSTSIPSTPPTAVMSTVPNSSDEDDDGSKSSKFKKFKSVLSGAPVK